MTFPAQVSSFTLSFGPQLDGAGYDPRPDGGVDQAKLFTPGADPATATAIATASSPTVSSDGLTYTFAFTGVPWGIYQPYVLWRPTSDPTQTLTPLSLLGVPVPRRTVTPESIARRAGLTLPLDANTAADIAEAIDDAEADALSVLNRQTLVPRLLVQAASPYYRAPSGYELDETPVRALISESPRTDGQFDVVYVGGLDVGGDPQYSPILRYVRAATIEILRDNPRYAKQLRNIRSLSNQGQSISWETNREALASAQGAGAAPTSKSIGKWKRHGIVTGRSRASLWGIYGGILPGGGTWDAGAAAEAWEMAAVGDARLPEAIR